MMYLLCSVKYTKVAPPRTPQTCFVMMCWRAGRLSWHQLVPPLSRPPLESSQVKVQIIQGTEYENLQLVGK